MAELIGRAVDPARLELETTQLNTSRNPFYGGINAEIPLPIRIERGACGKQGLAETTQVQREDRTSTLAMMGTAELRDLSRRDALSKPARHLRQSKAYV